MQTTALLPEWLIGRPNQEALAFYGPSVYQRLLDHEAKMTQARHAGMEMLPGLVDDAAWQTPCLDADAVSRSLLQFVPLSSR